MLFLFTATLTQYIYITLHQAGHIYQLVPGSCYRQCEQTGEMTTARWAPAGCHLSLMMSLYLAAHPKCIHADTKVKKRLKVPPDTGKRAHHNPST